MLALIPYGANVEDLDADELVEASEEQADEETTD
jgi:hypothetical protein